MHNFLSTSFGNVLCQQSIGMAKVFDKNATKQKLRSLIGAIETVIIKTDSEWAQKTSKFHVLVTHFLSDFAHDYQSFDCFDNNKTQTN